MPEKCGLPDWDYDRLFADTKDDLPPADDWEEADAFLKKNLSNGAYNNLNLPRKSLSMEDAFHLVVRFGDMRYLRLPS